MMSGTLKELSFETYKIIYNNITSTKVFARKTDITHNQMLYNADGYITAWFMHYLQNDIEAGQFFKGENPELLNNTYYQDQQINIVESGILNWEGKKERKKKEEEEEEEEDRKNCTHYLKINIIS